MTPRIPYFQTSRYRVQTMIELAEPKLNEIGTDLGSGDGRILIAFAKMGVAMHGFEIDEKLINRSKQNIATARRRPLPIVHNADFWNEDFSIYDIITIYPMPDIMEVLEEKLQKELKRHARLLLNYYPFPNWKETAQKDHIYLYRK